MNSAAMEGIELLIPKAILDRRRGAIRETCSDHAALIEALPTSSPTKDVSADSPLLDADPHACRDWLARVIRALPTQSNMEAGNGDV